MSFLIGISFLIAFRPEDAPDLLGYKILYHNSLSNQTFYEYLYVMLCRLFFSNGIPFQTYLTLLTISLFLSWYYMTAKLTEHMVIAFIAFIPFYGIYYFGIILRASIAVMVSYYGLLALQRSQSRFKYIVYYATITIASGFHNSASIFFFIPIFCLNYYSNKMLYFSMGIVLLFPLFGPPIVKATSSMALALFQYLKINRYNHIILDNALQTISISLFLIKSLIVGLVFVYFRGRIVKNAIIYNLFTNIYIFGIVLYGALDFLLGGARLGLMLLFSEFIPMILIYDSLFIKKRIALLFIVMVSIANVAALSQKGGGIIW